MNVTKTIKIDLTKREVIQISAAGVSGEIGSRSLCFELLENGRPWAVPADCNPALAFRTEQWVRGEYDRLPDGSEAVTVQDNRVTVKLLDQILAKAGVVALSLRLRDDALHLLESFPVLLSVEQGVGEAEGIPKEYFRLQTLAEVNEEIGTIWDAKGDGLLLDAQSNRLFLTAEGTPLGEGIVLTAAGVPQVGVSDAGKFLRVNAVGQWAAEEIAIGEEALF